MSEEIRVLHVVSALDCGGVESMLFNYYEQMNQEKIKFDFITHTSTPGILGEKFLDYSSKIWFVPPKRVNILKTLYYMNKIIGDNQNKYQIIHIHQDFSSVLPLMLAAIHGIPIRIVHAHSTQESKNKIGIILQSVVSKIINIFATHKFSCGKEAAKVLYKNMTNVIFLKNAIDIDKFMFSQEARLRLKKELMLDKTYTFIHVGRLTYPKNHDFLIDILAEYKRINNDWIMLFVGDGELREDIIKAINKKNLQDNIKLLGSKTNINELLSVADLLFLPSHFEGLPVSLVEAQASGIKCLVSENVPEEVKLTPLVEFISLLNKQEWLNKMISFKSYERICEKELIKLNGYDIKQAAEQYQEFILHNTVQNVR